MPGEKDGIPSNLNIDHFKCYKMKKPKGVPKFLEQQELLKDQFEEKNTRVRKPKFFCNAVDKNGEGILNPGGHLTCYKIKDVRGQPKFPQAEFEIDDQFSNGEPLKAQRGRGIKVTYACVPSFLSPLD